MSKKHGFSFSWKRAVGISSAKNKISRKAGIPLTKSGRQKKVGSLLGCAFPTVIMSLIILTVILLLFVGWGANCGRIIN